MAYFAIGGTDYLLDLCDPILSVRHEMSGVWVLSGRHDQDTGVESNWSIKGPATELEKEFALVFDAKLMHVALSVLDYANLPIVRTRRGDIRAFCFTSGGFKSL
jgi:hypothetical protein